MAYVRCGNHDCENHNKRQTRWMYGCDQYCITPKVDEKGKSGESQWFDDGRIEAIGDGIRPDEVRTEKNGGCDLHPSESRR